MRSLFDRIGGASEVAFAVDIFYRKVLQDPTLAPFFVGVDIDNLVHHQTRFLTQAFGGAPDYRGTALREAHSRLVSERGLSDAHFDAIVGHLLDALRQLHVTEDLIGEVAVVIESVRKDVLCR